MTYLCLETLVVPSCGVPVCARECVEFRGVLSAKDAKEPGLDSGGVKAPNEQRGEG